MDSQNPFAPRPPAYQGGFGRGMQMPAYSFSQISAPTGPPVPRPGSMRIFEGQVVDLREVCEDGHGRYLPLHLDDPSIFEVMATATNNVGMKDLMKKEKVVPVFTKANEDWNKTLDRAEEISRLIPMAASDEDRDGFITGVKAVHQKLSIPMGESVAFFLDRKHAEESARRDRRHVSSSSASGAQPAVRRNLFETDFGTNRVWAPEPVRQTLPKYLIGLEVRDNDLDRKGKVVGLTMNPDAVFSVSWEDGFEAELSYDEISKFDFPGASVHFDIGTPNPRARKGMRRNKDDLAAASTEWDRICASRAD